MLSVWAVLLQCPPPLAQAGWKENSMQDVKLMSPTGLYCIQRLQSFSDIYCKYFRHKTWCTEYTMTCTQVNIMNLIIIYTPVIIFVCNVGVVNRILPDHLILPGRKRWSLIGRGKFLAPEEKGRHQPHQLWPHGFLRKKGYHPPTRTHVFSLKPGREGLALWANLQ